MDHSLSLKCFKTFIVNVLLDHGGLPHVLPLAVHLDLGFGAGTLDWDLNSGLSICMLNCIKCFPKIK